MDRPPPPPEYILPPALAALVAACEKPCVADCCGINGFDFFPLHVTSFASARSGNISAHDLEQWETWLKEVEAAARQMEADESGHICHVRGMNQYFTRESLLAMIAEIRHSLAAGPAMLQLSEKLAFPKPVRNASDESSP